MKHAINDGTTRFQTAGLTLSVAALFLGSVACQAIPDPADDLTDNLGASEVERTQKGLVVRPPGGGRPSLDLNGDRYDEFYYFEIDGDGDRYAYTPCNLPMVDKAYPNAFPCSRVWHLLGMTSEPWFQHAVWGDFDADGRTELGSFNDGRWTFPGTNNYQIDFGGPGDLPVIGDYDGDGKDDIAVWRPSNGFWYAILSTTGQRVTLGNWGTGTYKDFPIPADYNGDGKTDLAIWRGTNYYVHIKDIASFQWGAKTDKMFPGDYNGDGYADAAVFRASNQTWYFYDVRKKRTASYALTPRPNQARPNPGRFTSKRLQVAVVEPFDRPTPRLWINTLDANFKPYQSEFIDIPFKTSKSELFSQTRNGPNGY